MTDRKMRAKENPKPSVRHPATRLVALIGLAVVLFTIALGVAIWRYEVSIQSERIALEEAEGADLASHVGGAIPEVVTSAGGFGSAPSPARRRQLRQALAEQREHLVEFEQHLRGEGEGKEIEAAAVLEARSRQLERVIETELIPVAGTPPLPRGDGCGGRCGRQNRQQSRGAHR